MFKDPNPKVEISLETLTCNYKLAFKSQSKSLINLRKTNLNFYQVKTNKNLSLTIRVCNIWEEKIELKTDTNGRK